MAYLRKHYQAGDFLVSGRRVPRTGGVILAKGDEPESVAAIVEEDPFVREGAATYEIVQFNPSQTAPGLRPFFS